jgi:hypothetical protein
LSLENIINLSKTSKDADFTALLLFKNFRIYLSKPLKPKPVLSFRNFLRQASKGGLCSGI